MIPYYPICLGFCLTVLLLSACATPSLPPSTPDAFPTVADGKHLWGTLVDVRAQRPITFAALVEAVASADVVAVGEEHYHPDIQAFALRLLQALAQRRPQRLALAMEFLERDGQQTVDAYLAGALEPAAFQERLGVSAQFMSAYFPLVRYARQHGLPVIAMNVPRRITRQIAREGVDKTLQQLGRSDQAYLPATLSTVSPAYRSYFLDAVASAHQLEGQQAEHYAEAAYLKDETMADSLARFLDQHQGFTVLAMAGRFHFDYGKAIPALLHQRRPSVVMRRITAMAVEADGRIDLQRLAREGIADYLWIVPPAPAEHEQRGSGHLYLPMQHVELQNGNDARLDTHHASLLKVPQGPRHRFP
jgi:uncharacterized iron-regulated protein